MSARDRSRPAATAAPSETPPQRDVVTLRVLTVAAFVVILNETVLVNAIPVLMHTLSIDARAAQWLSTGFMLTMAVVIPTTGWFLQRVGRRVAFATAMGSFCAGTLLAAFAPTFGILLAARVVQACGTAVMMPLLMSSVLALVPPAGRGRVMGNVSLAISVAPALGPALSGLVLSVASWRWLFGVVLPIAIGVAIMGLRLLRPDRPKGHGHLDLLSVALTVVGFGGLVHGLSQVGGDPTLQPWPPVGSLIVGLVGLVLFAWRQVYLVRHPVADPLLDLRVLRSGGYTLAVAIMALSFMALMGTMILLPLFLQEVRGLSTLQAGLLLMPGGLVMGVLGPRVGRLYDRVGAAPLVPPGAFVVTCALAGMAWATAAAPWWAFLALHMLASVALAFVFTPIFTSGLSTLTSHLYEHGTALLGTAQQVAAAAGTALVITVMAARSNALAADGTPRLSALSGGVQTGMLVGVGLGVTVVALALVLARVLTRKAARGQPAVVADAH